MTTILQHLLFSPFDTEALVRDGGLLIICLAVFAQTGLFFAFFVPSGVFLLLVVCLSLQASWIMTLLPRVFARCLRPSLVVWQAIGLDGRPALHYIAKKDTRFLNSAI